MFVLVLATLTSLTLAQLEAATCGANIYVPYGASTYEDYDDRDDPYPSTLTIAAVKNDPDSSPCAAPQSELREQNDPDGDQLGCRYCPCPTKCGSAIAQDNNDVVNVNFEGACTWSTCVVAGERICPQGYQCCVSDQAAAAGETCTSSVDPTDYICIPCQGAAFGDVHLVGFHGQNYDVDGRNNTWYSFFVDEAIAVNVHLKYFPQQFAWPVGSVISKVSVVTAGGAYKMAFDVDSDEPATLLPQAEVVSSADADHPVLRVGECGTVEWETPSRLVLRVGGYQIVATRNEFYDTAGKAHGKFLNVDVRAPGATKGVSGILGDTWAVRTGTYAPLRDHERTFIVKGAFDVRGSYSVFDRTKDEFSWLTEEVEPAARCDAVRAIRPVRIASSKDELPAHLRVNKGLER
eukprot:CAMPEP_0170734064 /NCGR_PEP_ID=MMETSP0437-20130122/2398_1 /TAXON_ID=0 /ORGANISM="Sexangularia sp." /LENGTH=405 /DNA_ID=CAMNT_0011072367 /DNA_START=68 /DNA_END=1282 /DNA_ORIENTATION=-